MNAQNSAKNPHKRTLVLLDSHAIIHRAFHALPDFASAKGEPTGALYGLSTMILKIASDLQPDYIVAAYDLPQATHRHEVFAAYKGTRKETDPALAQQIERSRDVLAAFSIPIYAVPGFEADDMLGTIVQWVLGEPSLQELEVVIASGDMDTLQLITGKRVRVYTLKKGIKDTIVYDEDGVRERFGFGPELLPDYKGLRGDPSDNIPGIKGIGEKTATDLIVKFGGLEKLFAELKKKDGPKRFEEAGVKVRMIELLKNGEEEALFSKELATIRRDAPISFQLPTKTWKESIDLEAAKKLFLELDFRMLGARVEAFVKGEKMTNAPKKESIKSPYVDAAAGETDGAASAGIVPLAGEEVDPLEFKKVSIALWLLDSEMGNPSLEDILGFAGKRSFAEAKEIIFGELQKQGLRKVFTDIEEPLIPILEKMTEHGIGIDKDFLADLSKDYHAQLSKIEKKIYDHAGGEFNINSPKQLGDVLFDKLGLVAGGGQRQKKTPGGARSTRESELEKLREAHPIIGEMLDYRELQKLLSTYIDTIPTLLGPDGRLHATFLQAGTTTGRMASQNPNIQNIPIKSELGREIRKAFVAAKGFTLLDLDYSQIELRVAAFLSGDQALINVFRSGRDIHTEVAARIFKVPAEQVDKEMRRRAKVINFGILYGMGVNALRQNLGTDKAEAQRFHDAYFETFPQLAEYLEKSVEDARKKGYSETFFGRRRLFPGLQSKLPFLRAMAERMALNAPIQGTQADIVKIAMKKIDDFIREEKLEQDVFLIMQVHDELIFEVRESVAKKIAPKIKALMEGVMPLEQTAGIPLKANAALGKNWDETEGLVAE